MIIFQDPEREKSLLYRLLLSPHEQLYIKRVNENLFDHPLYQQLFSILRLMYSKSYLISPQTVEDFIRQVSKAANSDQLIGLVQEACPQGVTTQEQIQYLTSVYHNRKINQLNTRVALMQQQKTPHQSILSFIQKEIQTLEHTHEVESIEAISDKTRARIEYARVHGPNLIRTGLQGLDEAIGLTGSTYLLVCGKSGEGKSSLLNQLLLNMLRFNTDVSVLYLSMEIEKVKVVECLVANLSRIPKDRLRGKGNFRITDAEMQTIDSMLTLIKSFEIEIEYGPLSSEQASLLIDVFVAKQRARYGEKRKVVVAADHHLYIAIEHNDQQQSINQFSKMLAHKKEEHGLLAILLCQMHEKSEERAADGLPVPPALKNIMFPGMLKKDCDVGVLIWRKNRVAFDEPKPEVEEVELWIEKNRDGQPLIGIPVCFTGKYGIFEDTHPSLASMNLFMPDCA